MERSGNLLLAYYGDDFTGSTDALEFLNRAGLKTILFIEPPGPEQLKRYEGLNAIGVAGMSRSMEPSEMEGELTTAFSSLARSGARHIHYKVCSTFDSSPTIGSIGKAIDIGTEIFPKSFVPILVAAPTLGRHCIFGNLFARMGTGSKGNIYRLDRHPSMSRHPVTPANESDLRLHLSRQTSKRIGLLDILQIALPIAEAKKAFEDIVDTGTEIIFFDALYEEQLANIGCIMDGYASIDRPLFSVGSSGIEMALGEFWKQEGKLEAPQQWEDPGNSGPLLVVSGSCSPVTSNQISWAVSRGFEEVIIDTEAIAKEGKYQELLENYISLAVTAITAGKDIILHTGCGPSHKKEEIQEDTTLERNSGSAGNGRTADLFGSALGQIARAVTQNSHLKRIVVAGGDTSSFAARAMGIEAVEMLAPLSPGAPLCKAYAPGSPVDGLEVNFKGGQVGSENYFGMVKEGRYVP